MVRVWCSILDSRCSTRLSNARCLREACSILVFYTYRASLSPWHAAQLRRYRSRTRWCAGRRNSDKPFTSSWSRYVLSRRKKPRLNMGDHLVLKSMKNIVICGNWCELWNFVSIVFLNENFSTDTSVSVLHLFQYINRIIRIYLCCSPSRHAMQWYKFSLVTRVIPTQTFMTCIWNQVWRPAELKHINKRRKRNQMRFP